MVGQRHGGVHRRGGQARQKEGRAGEKDGRGLAHRALQPQDDAGHDPRDCLGEDQLADGLPLRAAQRDAHDAELVGHAAHGFFRGADDDRQGHDGKRQRSGKDADAEFEEQHE